MEKEINISEWKPFSELKLIKENISNYYYKKEFVDKYNLSEQKSFISSNLSTGQVNFNEPIEVKEKNGVVYWRENDDYNYNMSIPEIFETQFGVFKNHNHGEFRSWLGKDDYDGLSEKEKKIHHMLGQDDYFIDGKFCDMFDYGEYSFAISSRSHMNIRSFKIVRVNKNLEAATMYDTENNNTRLTIRKSQE